MTHNKLTCLFGHHDYDEEYTKDKDGFPIHLCKICKRSGLGAWSGNGRVWCDYDEERNVIHRKWSDGDEFWYDKRGNLIHKKFRGGCELWKDNNGDWTHEKPKNWKYENGAI